MNRATRFALALVAFVAFAPLAAFAQLPDGLKSDLGPGVPNMKVRPGYRVTWAINPKNVKGLRDARFMQFSGDGKTLFLSQRRDGSILAFRNPDADGVYQHVTTFVKDKKTAQGMHWYDGWLYYQVPAEGSLYRANDPNGDGIADKVETILEPGTLPKPGGHPYNAVLVTGKEIYVSASDPKNMTEELDSDTKKIYVFDMDGKNKRVFASGVRNNEKLRFRPGTTEIWGFDNGNDNFGKEYGDQPAKDQPITDWLPPEELNHYVQDGFYGHPYLVGPRIPRPEFAKRPDIIELANKTTPPALNLPAHWACLGFTFIEKDHFGADHVGDIFVAAHGSWNSLKQVGACVERVFFDKLTGKPIGHHTIVDGFNARPDGVGSGQRWARPVDLVEAPDGTILFTSDDPISGIFRISKSTQAAGQQ
jgi:glucose/arabinose dehydrogenase